MLLCKMLFGVSFLVCAFCAVVSASETCPVSIDPQTAEIRINPEAFPVSWRPNGEGIRGPRGYRGYRGYKGYRGSQGEPGMTGPAGATGESGPEGPPGFPGSMGPNGNKGNMGTPGPAGSAGQTGSIGPTGRKGEVGEKGITGSQGPPGQIPSDYNKRLQELANAIEYLGKSWRTIGAYRVWFSEVAVDFHEGEKLCQSKGGRLAAKSIRDAGSRSVLYEIAKDKNARFWIGLYDIHQEGRFVWSDGVAFTQSYLWHQGEPNNAGDHGEDCAEIWHSGLNDLSCSTKSRVICEKDI